MLKSNWCLSKLQNWRILITVERHERAIYNNDSWVVLVLTMSHNLGRYLPVLLPHHIPTVSYKVEVLKCSEDIFCKVLVTLVHRGSWNSEQKPDEGATIHTTFSPTSLTLTEMQGRYYIHLLNGVTLWHLAVGQKLSHCRCNPKELACTENIKNIQKGNIQYIIILTLAESCMVKLATFSWEDSSSRLNLRICYGQIEKRAPAVNTQQ